MYIKLTSLNSKIPCYISSDHITHFQKDKQSLGTIIYFTPDDFITVLEGAEDVLALLKGGKK